MIPPAALAVHLCIGQAYAFSVFNNPMTKLLGIPQSAPNDWDLPTLGWIFSLAIFFLGLSAAFAGTWLESVGPRKAARKRVVRGRSADVRVALVGRGSTKKK